MFQLFYEYRIQQSASDLQCKFYIMLTFMTIFMASYRQYINYHNRYVETLINQNYDDHTYNILYYTDALNLIQQQPLIFYASSLIFATSIISIPLLFLIIFIQKRLDEFQFPYNQYHGQALQILLQSSIWIFYYPSFYIVFTILSSHTTIDSRGWIYIIYIMIAVVCLIIMLLITFLTPFFTNDCFNKKDFLNTDNMNGMVLFNCYRILMALINNIKWDDYELILQGIQIILSSFLYLFLQNGSFIVVDNQNLFSFMLLFQGSLNIACAVHNISILAINTNESIYFLCIFCSFSIYLHKYLQDRQKYKLLIIINDFGLIRRKIQILSKLINENDITRNSIYWGIMMEHLHNQCIRTRSLQFNCFCNQRHIYFAKKKEDCSTNYRSLYLNQNIFSKFICKIWIEQYLLMDPQNQEAQIYKAKYLFYKLKLIQESLVILQKLKIQNQYLQYEQLSLYQNIVHHQDRSNFLSYCQRLQFEDVLLIEQIIRDIQTLMTDIIQTNTRFWKLYLKPVIYENDILNITNQVQNKIHQCEQFWNQILQRQFVKNDHLQTQQYLNKHYVWVFQYCWYLLYIQNKSIKQTLLDQLPNLNPTIEQLMKDEPVSDDSEHEREENHFKYYNVNKPYDDQTAIIHTNCDENLKITKVNNSFYNVFGYQKEEVLKQSINKLLPNLITRNHRINVKNFIHKGHDYCIHNKKIIFGINKMGYLIQCSKYLKFVIRQNQIEFICMIRPIKSQTNIILLNLDWEIESISQQLSELLKIDKVSLLLLCPKLLQYSNYQNYMQIQDLDNFELNVKRQSKLIIGDRKFTHIKQVETPPEFDKDPDSLIFKQSNVQTMKQTQQDSDSDTPIILTQALIEDQTIKTQQLNKVHHLVDANHVSLNIRMPKKLDEVINQYNNFKKHCLEQKLPQLFQKIVESDHNSKIIIHKRRLIRQIQIQKQMYYERMLDNFRFLFFKYLRRKGGLRQIIKLDVNIQFPQNRCFDKYIVLVVNRFEMHSSNKQSVNYRESFFMSKEKLNKISEQVLANQEPQVDFDSYRSIVTKPLVTELYEINLKEPTINLRKEENIFIKDENNKAQKYQTTLHIFNLMNRMVIVGFLICTIIMYMFGFQQLIYKPVRNYGVEQMNIMMQVLSAITRTHDYTVDLSLFNSNVTRDIVLDTSITPFSNDEEYINATLEGISYYYNFIYFVYVQTNFVQMFYYKSVNFNETQNAIDLFDQYQNNLVQVFLIDPTLIYPNYESLFYFRAQTYPALFQSFVFTQDNLFNFIQENLFIGQRNLIYLLITGLSMAGICLVLSILILISIQDKIITVYEQSTHIDRKSIYEIVDYYNMLFNNFMYLTNNKRVANDSIMRFKSEQIVDQEKQVYHKTPLYKKSQQWRLKKIKNSVIYSFFFLVIIALPLFYNLYVMLKITDLKTYLYLNSFTRNYDQYFILTAVKEMYIYKNLYQTNIWVEQYQYFLEQFVNHTTESIMYQTTLPEIQILFDGNLCDYIQEFMNDSDSYYCSMLLDGALTRGIRQYNYILTQQITSLLDNDTRFDDAKLSTIEKFNTLFKYVFFAYQKAWNMWQDEFLRQAQYINNVEMILMILSLFNMVGQYMILETILFRQLNKDFKFSKLFYKRYIPDSVITNQKRIRVALIRCSVLKK